MKVSIITSLYRTEKLLPAFFENLATFSIKADFEFEIIFVLNDGTDMEKEIIEKKIGAYDAQLLEVDREPLYQSWNRGIEASKYDLITFWNADDTRFPEAISETIKKSVQEDFDIAYFPFIYKRSISLLGIELPIFTKTIRPKSFDQKVFTREMHCGPFFIAKKEVFEKVGLFDTSFKISGDFEWCARASAYNLNLKKINTVAGVFTNNGKTLSGSKNSLQDKENEIVYARYR
jgi:hypothetical protein